MKDQKLKVATIDLYNNEKNEGMRCIKEIVKEVSDNNNSILDYKIYDTRFKSEIPDLSNDIFISSGGPGSPFEGEGTEWEKKYFKLIDGIWDHNQNNFEKKKYIFFICHSFQMMARYFEFGKVSERHIQSFGVLPFHKTEDGNFDELLSSLGNPFYAADIRKYQVTEPDEKILNELEAKILAWEIPETASKKNPAIAAVRITGEIAGTQFHPEADPESMLYHLKQDERKAYVVDNFGENRYKQMITYLGDPEKIKLTRETVLPTFLQNAIDNLISVSVKL